MRLGLPALLLVIVGCKEPAPVTVEAAAKPADAAAIPAELPPIGGKLGVPACDEYLEKMSRCIAHLTPEAQAPMRSGLEESRAAWRTNAGTAEGRAALAPTCKQALDVAKSAAAAMGCDW